MVLNVHALHKGDLVNANQCQSVLQRVVVGIILRLAVNLLLWPYVPLGAIRNYDEPTYCTKQDVFVGFGVDHNIWHLLNEFRVMVF